MPKDMTIRTAGYNEKETLRFSAGPGRCGGLTDTVSFAHIRDDGRSEGAWAISYRDLMRMAKAATAARKNPATEPSPR